MATKPTNSTSKKAKRSTTRAAATTPKAAAKTAAKTPKTVVSTKASAATAAVAPIEADKPVRDEVTKKELVASMVAATGMKKGDARRAMEATVTAIAEALNAGKDLSLPPLGKIKIARTKETPNGKLVVMRAKLKDPKSAAPKDPLAAAAE